MSEFNFFEIARNMGGTLGPRVEGSWHGFAGSSQLAATLSVIRSRRQAFADEAGASLSKQYIRGVLHAFETVRDGYSHDFVVAHPAYNKAFLQSCRDDFGLDDTDFRLNLTLLRLRKAGQAKAKRSTKRASVEDQWRIAWASEMAARSMFYRYGLSADSLMCNPKLVSEFDELAQALHPAPDRNPFDYRWTAINIRKKGYGQSSHPTSSLTSRWSHKFHFSSTKRLPSSRGVYALREADTYLYIGGSPNIQESAEDQRRLVDVTLIEPTLWRPDSDRLFWQFMDYRNETETSVGRIVDSAVRQLSPVFNIPRGGHRSAA